MFIILVPAVKTVLFIFGCLFLIKIASKIRRLSFLVIFICDFGVIVEDSISTKN